MQDLDKHFQELQKYNKKNQSIKLRLGKRLFTNGFQFSLELFDFERLLDKIKNLKSYRKIEHLEYQEYHKYQRFIKDINKTSSCFENLFSKSYYLDFCDRFDLLLEYQNYREILLDKNIYKNCNKTKQIDSILFLFDKFEIEFSKIFDDCIYYQIQINLYNNSSLENIKQILNYLQ